MFIGSASGWFTEILGPQPGPFTAMQESHFLVSFPCVPSICCTLKISYDLNDSFSIASLLH